MCALLIIGWNLIWFPYILQAYSTSTLFPKDHDFPKICYLRFLMSENVVPFSCVFVQESIL